jgi:putative cell wall-binding protein
VINTAHANGVKVVPTITMMAWDGDYSGMSQLLNSAEYRARLIDDVASVIGARNADGVNVDFEPVPASLRGQFSAFIRELKSGLVARGVGSYLTVDTMAGAASWSTGYDIEALTAPGAADALMVMAYDFSWSGSARAGGVAPAESDYIYAAGDALRAHLARVPASKLIWGVPYYGRAWNTTSDAQNATVRSPAQSVAFSYYWTDDGAPAGGKILAERYGRRWDATGQVPWFAFSNADGGLRQGYYDDPTSLAAKYDMVVRNGLAGIGIWTLGMDTGVDDLWNVIRSRFAGSHTRLAGADRYGTAAAISAASYPAGVPVAYVATGADYPDALAAGPAASRGGGPVLLVTATRIPASTVQELQRLRPARIVVLGGPVAVSDGVLGALVPFAGGGGVQRLAGADRYATAAAVSAATFPAGVPVAYVTTGTAFPDALTGGVAAGREGGPLLLVQPNQLPAVTAGELSRLRPARIVVLGGTGAVTDGVLAALQPYAIGGGVTRLAGADRYETAIAISRATTPGPVPTVYIATGRGFADGLAGSPPAARSGVPLLIVNPAGLTPSVAEELRRLSPSRVIVLGGVSAVPDAVVAQITALWD